MNDSLRNKLKSQYEDLHEIPSADVWNNLEEKLNAQTEVSRKRKFPLMQLAAAITLLIGLLIVWQIFITDKETPTNSQISKNHKKDTLPTPNITKEIETTNVENSISTTSENILEKNNASNKNIVTETKSKKENDKPHLNIQNTNSKEIILNKNFEDQKSQEENSIANINDVKEVQDLTNDAIVTKKEMKKYVSSKDLVFQRELERVEKIESKSPGNFRVVRLRKLKIFEPTTISIFDHTIINSNPEKN